MSTLVRLSLMLLALVALPLTAAAQAPQFTVELLQAPADGGVAFDLNDAGVIVGHVTANGRHAVIWNGKKMIDLGPLSWPIVFGHGERPAGINRTGIGFFNSGTDGFVFNVKSPAGAVTVANAALAGISDSGRLAGTTGDAATLWDGTTIRQLPSQSAGLGVNNFGTVTGFVNFGEPTAIRWSRDGDVERIELLPSLPNGSATAGYAIDDFGNVVGASSVAGANRAVAWFGSAATELVALPNSATSRAWDINVNQWVVGESTNTQGRARATLWVDGVAYELVNLIIGRNPFDNLTIAFGLNDRGEIVGAGEVNGVMQPFVLHPSRKGKGN